LSELGYLAAGRAVSDNWGVVLLVAIGASAVVVGLPVLGVVLAFVLSSMGLGTTYLYYREDDQSPSDRSGKDGPNGSTTADRSSPPN